MRKIGEKTGEMCEFMQNFLAKTAKKETEKPPQIDAAVKKEINERIKRTIIVFLVGPLLTWILLWILELTKMTDGSLQAFGEAAINTFRRGDIIFLVFSLVLTVILEWTITMEGIAISKLIVGVEVILGLLSVALYFVEEMMLASGNTQNAIMLNREIIHILFLSLVILVAFIGYREKIRKMFLNQNSQGK